MGVRVCAHNKAGGLLVKVLTCGGRSMGCMFIYES